MGKNSSTFDTIRDAFELASGVYRDFQKHRDPTHTAQDLPHDFVEYAASKGVPFMNEALEAERLINEASEMYQDAFPTRSGDSFYSRTGRKRASKYKAGNPKPPKRPIPWTRTTPAKKRKKRNFRRYPYRNYWVSYADTRRTSRWRQNRRFRGYRFRRRRRY